MRHPSIDKLLEIVDSKYQLVLITSKRAKDIEQGAKTLLENSQSVKPVGITLEEIVEGKLIIK